MFGSNRNVLEVRIPTAQPASGGDRLIEAGVHPPGFPIDQEGQGVDIRPLELLQRAPVQNQARKLVNKCEFLEYLNRGRNRSRLRVALQRGKLQLVEEDLR